MNKKGSMSINMMIMIALGIMFMLFSLTAFPRQLNNGIDTVDKIGNICKNQSGFEAKCASIAERDNLVATGWNCPNMECKPDEDSATQEDNQQNNDPTNRYVCCHRLKSSYSES